MADPQLPLEPPAETPPPDADLSLAEHEQQYSRRDDREPPREATTEPATPPAEVSDEAEPAPEGETAEQKAERERDEAGRFVKSRHRAKSQQASPEDVPRIRELTARLRAAEAERDALKQQGRPASPPATIPSAPAPAAKPRPVFADFAAQETDFGVAVEKYTDAVTDWKHEQFEAQRQAREREHAQAAERQRLAASWNARVDAAEKKYPDFKAVALETPSRIPPGSLIDAWILEHKTGPEVLYHLQTHDDDLTALLNQPLFEQAEALALLSQRFNGTAAPPQAVGNGSAASEPSRTVAPRPPNPLRTGPLRAGDEPPGEGSGLLEHERFYPVRRPRG